MSQEVKAGLAAVLFVAALVGVLVFLRGGDGLRDRGYDIHVVVDNAGGILVGAATQMAGVEVGRVSRVELTPDRRARITVRIRSGVSVPEGSRFSIASAGLLGDRYVAISPRPGDAPPIAPDTEVAGTAPPSVEELYDRVIAVARQAEEAFDHINRVIGDPRLAEAFSDTIRTAREATTVVRRAAQNVERTTRALDRVLLADLPVIMVQVRTMSAEMAAAAARLNTLAREVAADGQTAQRVRHTVQSIERAADGIEQMVRDLRGVVNEREVGAVRQSLAEARSAVEEARAAVSEGRAAISEGRAVIGRADDVVRRVRQVIPEKIELPDLRSAARLEYGLWYDGRRVGHDVTLELQPFAPTNYLFTLREFGGRNLVGIQVASRLDERLRIRYGLVDSHLGVGVDYRISPLMSASAELSNISQATLNVSLRYALTPTSGLSLRAQSLLTHPAVGVGAYYRF
jgi:ABC-type transporter Mla subunit MlaD